MPSSTPSRLFSRFNKAAKTFLASTALGAVLASGTAMAADPAGSSSSLTPVAAQQNHAVNYEYVGNRTIRLSGPVNQETAEAIINKMIALSQEDPDADIELRINSPGGDVNQGMAIYDVMKSLPNDIRTVCEGNAQSMGAFLLSAGTQGKRYSYPNCEIMYHQPSWGTNGKITDMTITTAEGNATKDKMIRVIAEDTGWSEKVVRDLLERNFYPNAEEAREMGFIDHVIEETKPDPAPTPKTKANLPGGFCDNQGRKHMDLCQP